MSWTLLIVLVIALGLALGASLHRRSELERMARRVRERDRAVRNGAVRARLQHPVVDLTRCLGCGACVRACPEDGVLGLVHGQAQVVNGARCTGVSACERECPTGAITVALSDAAGRRDIPAVDERLEAVGAPGLFLAGEVTARALIKNAIEQGTAVAAEVARRVTNGVARPSLELDLIVVGAGPAGLACALEAQRHGLRFVVLDQEPTVGGTVARYPRRKLVLTRPVDLPQGGRLERDSYSKEELMAVWTRLAAERRLPLRTGTTVTRVERRAGGGFDVHTTAGAHVAAHVCLALGRRGTPRKLGVPGEDRPKVAYALLDANAYEGRRILVVGGGDSAVETALALAEQPGNEVALSYRRDAFFRIQARTAERLERALAAGRLRTLPASRVLAIEERAVELEVRSGAVATRLRLENDDVFVLAGGVPPFALLEQSGVSFDPALRPAIAPIVEQGSGLVRALAVAFGLSLLALGFALVNVDYYGLPADARPVHDKHDVLRPALGLGLGLGLASAALVIVNLLYVLRRSQLLRLSFGSLRSWMTAHVATGILALLLALLHAGMQAGDSVGGHALLALAVLLTSGAIGRYLYAYVPRAANGRELELGEIRLRVARLSEAWTGAQRAFAEGARARIDALVDARQWRSSFAGRVGALLLGQRDLRRTLADLRADGARAGVPADLVAETLVLAREAHRAALMAAHYEDLRALLASWRWVHRWVAALLVLLLALHVVYALSYGSQILDRGLT